MCVEYSWHVEVKQISKKDDTTPSNKCKSEQDGNLRLSPQRKQESSCQTSSEDLICNFNN